MIPASPDDDALLEAALQDFSRQLHSAFPLRHFGEFHDEGQLKEKILQLQENVSKNVFSEVWNRDQDEVCSLIKKLRERMSKEVIAEWMAKNKKHKMESVSYLLQRAEALCKDFQLALEDQLLLNPDMEMDSLKSYADHQKKFAINYFDDIWKPKNIQIVEERKAKMECFLAMIEEEVIEKHGHVLKTNAVNEGERVVVEVKTIVLEKSRQLKSYVDSNPRRVSKRYLKSEVGDIKEYLMTGKGSTLRERQKEIYSKMVETLEDAIQFLNVEKVERKAKTLEDYIHWAEGLDRRLKSYCSDVERGKDDTHRGIQEEANRRDSSELPDREQILNNGLLDLLEQESSTPEEASDGNNAETVAGGEGEEVLIVNKKERTFSKADVGPQETMRTRLRRFRHLKSVTSMVQAFRNDHSHAETFDELLPKKRRRGIDLSWKKGKEKEADGFVHQETPAVNEKAVDAAQAMPSRKSGRLNQSSNKLDVVNESTGESCCATKESLSSLHNEMLEGEDQNIRSTDQDKLIHSTQTRPQSNSEIPVTSTRIVDESIDLHLPSAQAPPPRRSRRIKKHFHERDLAEESAGVRVSPTYQSASSLHGGGETPDGITILGGYPPKYKCDVCKMTIMKKGSFKYHGRFCCKTRPRETLHKCHHCDMRFFKKAKLMDHMRSHTGEKPYKCPTCDKRFTRNWSLLVHIRSHTGNTLFACEKCDHRFMHRYSLKQHMLSHEGKLPFGCSYCGQRCHNMVNLMGHLLTHSDEQPFRCGSCNRPFGLKSLLVRHLRTVHCQQKEDAKKQANDACLEYLKKVTNNPNYDGDISSTVVLSHAIKKANLRIPDKTEGASSRQATETRDDSFLQIPTNCPEEISILGGNPLTYKCDVCGNEMKRRSKLKHHGKNCAKKRCKCHHCGKQFSRMANLVDHLRTHTGEKPFKCSTCNKQFARKSNFQSHVVAHSTKGQFLCEKCKRSFRDRHTLNRHMLRHEGKLPFGCSYCDHRCVTMGHLKEHVMVHCDERPYKCPSCERNFSWKRILVCHIQSAHHVPREDAMMLATEAGAEYIRKVTGNPNYDGDISEPTVLSYAIKKANLKIPE